MTIATLPAPAPTTQTARVDARARKRFLVAASAVGIPLAALAGDTLVRAALGWRPAPGEERRAAFVILLLPLAWLALLALPFVRRFLARRWAVVVLLSLIGLGLWGAFEAAIPQAPFHLRLADQREVFQPDPRWVPGVSGDGRLSVNEAGIRGDPLPARGEAYRILCIGGSTTECLYLDDQETWTRLLQDRLSAAWGRPVWVGNAGISGYATTEHIAFLEGYDRLREFDRVVVMAGFNDLVLSTLGERKPIRVPGTLPLWQSSSAYRLARARWNATKATSSPFQDPSGRWIEERREVRRPAPRRESLPDLTPALATFESRLERIADLCAEAGVPLALATQAVLWRPDLSPEGESLLWTGWTADRSAFYTSAALRSGMDAFNARVSSVARRRGLPLVDVSPVSGDVPSFYDDCHFTELGSRRVAELVASQLPIPRGY